MTAVIVAVFTMVMEAAAVPANATVAPAVKFVPDMVTVVPPVFTPNAG